MAEAEVKVILPSTQFVLRLCIPSFTLPSFKNALLGIHSFTFTQFWLSSYTVLEKVLYLVLPSFENWVKVKNVYEGSVS